MPDFTQRPDGKFIDDAHLYYQKLWNRAHARWTTYDEYYNRTFALWDLASDAGKLDRPSYRPSTGRNRIDHAADAQLAFVPRVQRDPVGNGEDAETDADDVESATRDLLENSGEREMYLPWKQAGRHSLQYGYFITEFALEMGSQPYLPPQRTDEGKEDWAGRQRRYEAEKSGWNPFRIKVPNPARVLLDPNEKESPIAIKLGTKRASSLEADLRKKKRQRRPYVDMLDNTAYQEWTPVPVVEVWTRHWHAMKVMGGKMLFAERNTWGIVPFMHAYSGFGMDPVKPDEMDPRFMAVGLLDGVLDSLKVQAQAATAKHQLLLDKAFGELITTQDPNSIAQQQRRGAGIIQTDPKQIGRMPVNEYDRSLAQIYDDIVVDIEEGTYARPLGGYREGGVSTVGQQIVLSAAAKTKLIGPAKQVEIVASRNASWMLQMVDTIKPLGGRIRKLRRSAISGNYEVKVTFEVADAVLDLRRREFGLAEMRDGAKDLRTYLEEDARVDNVSERIKRLDDEAVRNHPSVRQYFLQLSAKGLGLGDIFDPDIQEDDIGAVPPAAALEALAGGQRNGPQPTSEPGAQVAAGPGPTLNAQGVDAFPIGG
jgi:hypothetical protein